MKYLKLFEDYENGNGVITYHGGENELSIDNFKEVGIFTTTDKEAAIWYSYRAEGFLTTLEINLKKPLPNYGKEDFKDKWKPILDEVGIDYTFEEDEDGKGWFIELPEYDDNLFDLIYNEEFLNAVKKHGYDGMTGWDTMFRGSIEVYIPFYKKCVKIISNQNYKENKYVSL